MINELTNSLAKKLLIKPGKRWLFFNAPENYLALLEPLPEGVSTGFEPVPMPAEGGLTGFDGVQVFVKNSAELALTLKIIAPILNTDTIFWVCYPKKSSGIESNLEMMGSWDDLPKYGLRTVAAASVNETWTAIRLRQPEQTKVSEFCSAEIKKNKHSAYIDLDNRQITLPQNMKEVLAQAPNALAFFQTLSFSNKKEYVAWILSAKQEKTREERLVKMVGKLESGKKNPADK